MSTGQKLSGLNPLSYIGVEPTAPPQVRLESRRPTTKDYAEYNIGTWWLMIADQEVWILISKVGGVATWIQLYPGSGGGGASAFPCDVGTANQAGGEVNVFGGSNMNTAGTGNTVRIHLNDDIIIGGFISAGGDIATLTGNMFCVDLQASDDVSAMGQCYADQGLVAAGGGLDVVGTTRLRDLTAGVMQTNSIGTVSSTNGTNGQVIIGGGTAPAWANLSSTGGSIVITEGANTINLETSGAPSANVSYCYYLQTRETATDPTAPYLWALGKSVKYTKLYENGSNFFPGDGAGNGSTFTVPQDGVYYFSINLYIGTLLIPESSYAFPYVKGPSAGFYARPTGPTGTSTTIRNNTLTCNCTLDLSTSDVVEFYLLATVGVGEFRMEGTTTDPDGDLVIRSWIQGWLVD